MFDLNRTIKLVTGALFNPEETWRGYRPEAENWQKTAFLITGPVIIATAILGYLIGLMGDGRMFGALRPSLMTTLMMMVFGLVWAGIVGFIVAAISGMFGGKNSFALGLAATTLAFVPGYVGQALSRLPWVGWLLGLGLFIYSLVLLWRAIPVFLEVPDGRRPGHYIVSLIACIVTGFVLGMLLRPITGPIGPGPGDVSGFRSGGDSAIAVSGSFGGPKRQSELIAASEDDRYTSPLDGTLEEEQVEEFIRVMNRARDMMDERAERLHETPAGAEHAANRLDTNRYRRGRRAHLCAVPGIGRRA